MRELSFRIWLEKEKRFYYFDIQDAATLLFISSPMLKLKVDQSTGVYDKTGEKIYENDIVKFNNGIYSVEFCQKSCSFILRNNKQIWWLSTNKGENIEIITNIYEDMQLSFKIKV